MSSCSFALRGMAEVEKAGILEKGAVSCCIPSSIMPRGHLKQGMNGAQPCTSCQGQLHLDTAGKIS